MESSSRREAVAVIRSLSVELSEQVRDLLALPAASRVDRQHAASAGRGHRRAE